MIPKKIVRLIQKKIKVKYIDINDLTSKHKTHHWTNKLFPLTLHVVFITGSLRVFLQDTKKR